MGKRKREVGGNQRLTNCGMHAEGQRADAVGRRERGFAFVKIRIKKPRQKCLFLRGDIAQNAVRIQRQRSCRPIAIAGQTKDAGGICRRDRWGVAHGFTGAILGAGQQGHIEPAAKQWRRVGIGLFDQRLRRFQRAKVQQFVNARQKQRAFAIGAQRRISFGQHQYLEEFLHGRKCVDALGADQINKNRLFAGRPDAARQPADVRWKQTNRVFRQSVQRSDCDIRRGCIPHRRHLIERCRLDAARQPVDGRQRLSLRITLCRRNCASQTNCAGQTKCGAKRPSLFPM